MTIPPKGGGGDEPWRSACSHDDLPAVFTNKGFDPFDTTLYPKGFPSNPELLLKIFDFSDETRTIFHHARNHRPKAVHPIALLMRELIRRGMRTPVEMRLDNMPLSTYVVTAGRSGTGKSEAGKKSASPWPDLAAPQWLEDIAARKTPPPDAGVETDPDTDGPPAATAGGGAIARPAMQPTLIPYPFDGTESVGSGQALTDFLVTSEGRGDETTVKMVPHPAVFIDEDEMLGFLRAAKGESSTMVPVFNSAWTGAEIGNTTKTHGNRRTPPGAEYNIFLWGGLQPAFAHELFSHDDSGFFQRTFLCAVTDPYRRIAEPPIPMPTVKPSGAMPHINPGDRFTVDQEVRDEIDDALGDSDFDHLPDAVDEAKSHTTQVRIRIACLAALLHGKTHITKALWDWTAHLMEHSNLVDAWLRAEAEIQALVAPTRKGADLAVMRATAAATENDSTTDALIKVFECLKMAGPEGVSAGYIVLTKSARPFKAAALTEGVKKGHIEVVPGSSPVRYRLASQTAPPPAPGGGIATPGQAAAPAPTPIEAPAPAPTTVEVPTPAPSAEAPAAATETPAPPPTAEAPAPPNGRNPATDNPYLKRKEAK